MTQYFLCSILYEYYFCLYPLPCALVFPSMQKNKRKVFDYYGSSKFKNVRNGLCHINIENLCDNNKNKWIDHTVNNQCPLRFAVSGA